MKIRRCFQNGTGCRLKKWPPFQGSGPFFFFGWRPVALSQIRFWHRTAVSPKECSRVLLVDCNNVRGRGRGGRFVAWLLEARFGNFEFCWRPSSFLVVFFFSIWWHFPKTAKCDFGRCTAWRGTYDTSAYHQMITVWLWWGPSILILFGDIYSIKRQFGGENCSFFAKREQWNRETHVESIADSLSLSKVHICSDIFCPTKVTEVPHLHTILWTQNSCET